MVFVFLAGFKDFYTACYSIQYLTVVYSILGIFLQFY